MEPESSRIHTYVPICPLDHVFGGRGSCGSIEGGYNLQIFPIDLVAAGRIVAIRSHGKKTGV